MDAGWVTINGNWKYGHSLLGAISNYIVSDAIYDTEDEKTVTNFLKESQ